MAPVILNGNPQPDDDAWNFTATIPAVRREGFGKHVSFTAQTITLDMILYPSNRMIRADETSKFILASFENLRFPDKPASLSREYMMRLFKAGLYLNGRQYRFYGHSNSQLRSRSCFLREANSDEELDNRIYAFGDFARIMNVAKRAKRIGLLFSKAELDWILDPRWTDDIDDIVINGETFSDGCGLMSRRFAVQLSRRKRYIYHGRPYTPCVMQIRYRGYKGVIMLHPELNEEHHVHFRASQKKFTATQDNTFSIVDHSVPYAFGRLNNDIIVLLASLGVTTEALLAKQEAYHHWIRAASDDWEVAFNFLCALGQYETAERLLLEGIDTTDVRRKIRACQMSELASFKKNEKFRSRMIVLKSRLLFGVCDPYGVLREGEVHVRVSVPRRGASTLKNTEVMVVRNPCLHPGDCLKLWAVDHPRLAHLVDCVVFSSKGGRAAPSMSSGGDLDGDRFLVMWDNDMVPNKVAESYTYPAAKEHVGIKVTREDLARHFAAYNTMTLAKITSLHAKWVRCSPKGAMSDECQDLNALHSHAVDGAPVRIPERLLTPPQPDVPYVIDLLAESAKAFFDGFLQSHEIGLDTSTLPQDVAEEVLSKFLSSEKLAVSEYETIMMAARFARKNGIHIRPYLCHIDFGALSTAEKHALSMHLELTPDSDPYLWNSLIRSEILRPHDLENRRLDGPLRLQKLYTSTEHGRAAFFEYLREAVQEYKRRLIILKTEDRFSVGIFLRGAIPWDDEPEVNDNVLVCPFMPLASEVASTYWRGTKGYRLHCGENAMQLYDKSRGNTFIFMTRPPEKSGVDIVTSIALQKISARVQKQCGRIFKAPVVAIEIHVVSNRDRVAHQAFDLRFEHVPTDEFLRRFDKTPHPFKLNNIHDFDWAEDDTGRRIFTGAKEEAQHLLSDIPSQLLSKYFQISLQYHSEEHVFLIFDAILSQDAPSQELIDFCLQQYPSLAYSVLKKYIPAEPTLLPEAIAPLASSIVLNVVRSANSLGIAALAALERLAEDIRRIDLKTYVDILWRTTLSVRAPALAQELLLVLHENRIMHPHSNVLRYTYQTTLGIAFDRAEEAADSCPCDDTGRPKRQRIAPVSAKLVPPKPPKSHDEPDAAPEETSEPGLVTHVVAHVRVDAQTAVRIHSHVRLKVTSPPEGPHAGAGPTVIDATVTRATRGELHLEVQHPLPPEYERVDWHLYNAGSVATSKAMMDAVLRLATDGIECCAFAGIITDVNDATGEDVEDSRQEAFDPDRQPSISNLNASQRAAVVSADSGKLALIWGPPGTGKTTVVVQILVRFLREDPEAKILMTASTHNAVDNVLERFLVQNDAEHLISQDHILRVATDSTRVNKSLQKYTIDARVGGSINENPKLVQKAEQRVKQARIVFTTCTGAGLGILRNMDFDTVLIDEASQITEPGALIPLVKGCRRAVLVGDHVQLRPTVRPMGKALEFDRSLFERLYTGPDHPRLSRTMLDVQYRFPAELARFPSQEFYEGRLQTGTPRTPEAALALGASSFPWPARDGGAALFPVVFVPCTAEEDYGRSSKSNEGQVELVKHICALLRTPRRAADADADAEQAARATVQAVSLAVLTPYARQVQLLKQALPASAGAAVSTIDGFQGREADVVVLSTVRANAEGDIGFVEDARRLNVAWTRPRLGLVVVGSRATLQAGSALWARALAACEEVVVARPDEEPEHV